MNIYTGYEKSPTKGKGPGIFGGAVLRKLSHIAVEEEGRLSNFTIREHFSQNYLQLLILEESNKMEI